MRKLMVNIDLPEEQGTLETVLIERIDMLLEEIQKERGLSDKEFDWEYDNEPGRKPSP